MALYQNFVNMEDVWLQINKQTLIVEPQVQTIWEYIQINAADLRSHSRDKRSQETQFVLEVRLLLFTKRNYIYA